MAPPLPPITISKIETNLPLPSKQTETESQPSTCTPLPFHHSSSPINLFLLLLHSPLSPSKQKKNGGLTETGHLRCLPRIENMVTIYRSLDSAFSAKAFQMDLNQADQLSPRSPPSFGDNKDSENDSNDRGSDDSPQNYKAENLLQLNSDNKRKRRQESHINSDNKIPKLQQNNIPSSLFRVKMLSENAVLPSRGSPLSAGCDLSSVSAAKVPARGKALIPTDLSIAIPEGTYARIAPRSGLTWKHSIDVGAGVIDADYRGPVGVILFNHSDLDFEVKVDDSIALLIIQKIVTPNVMEVEDLDANVRGAGGFGNSLRVKRLSENAVLPSRGSPLSAGYDLSSVSAAKVPARGIALIPTDLSIAIPEGTYARIAPRSGLTWKHSIDVGDGVIVADYRGPVGVILFNHSDVDFEVKVGDRIAQLIIEMIVTPNGVEVEDLDATVRGAGGFGNSLRMKRLSENVVLPSRGSPLSAGCDLSSVSAAKVPARGIALIPTDLSIAIPEGTYARIAPRSGLTWKHSIDVGGGVIDADYRGPVEVILCNHSDLDFEVKVGDRIAQIIIQKIMTDNAVKVEDLDATVRGAGGFGSTGVRACCAS
ncbi:hypothetical protein OIU84_011923 [Salix udensis]|uniref:dUTP diphosphatase n=1 Tax=Salix udensis TaxID=889485 RepID=A0AAD6JED6_9ROSI|nr:hypothetical protein OIU84_011923 [Salix udensis]